MAGVMSGLTYALQQGITHRDLKMSNVLVSSEGDAKLVDFGLAGVQGAEEAESEGFSRRTIDYAGLERATGCRQDDPRTDIFFAGTIFYQMLTAHPALPDNRDRAQAGKARYQDIKPILELVPKLPLPLAMVVNKALEFDPDKRYQTPGDMLVDLKLAIKRAKGAKRRQGERAGTSQQRGPRRTGPAAEADDRRIRREDAGHAPRTVQTAMATACSCSATRTARSIASSRTRKRPTSCCSPPAPTAAPPLEAFNRFGQEPTTRDLPAVLLLDEHHGEWEEGTLKNNHRVVVKMPLKQRDLRAALVRASRRKVS